MHFSASKHSTLQANQDRNDGRTIEHVFQALLYQLVRSAHQVQPVDLVELCCDLPHPHKHIMTATNVCIAKTAPRHRTCPAVFPKRSINSYLNSARALAATFVAHCLGRVLAIDCEATTLQHSIPASRHSLSGDPAPSRRVAHLAAKEPACAARADSPGLDVLRVAPHQVAERPLMRYLAHPLDGAHLRQRRRN